MNKIKQLLSFFRSLKDRIVLYFYNRFRVSVESNKNIDKPESIKKSHMKKNKPTKKITEKEESALEKMGMKMPKKLKTKRELQAELTVLVNEEKYEQAAKIRDRILKITQRRLSK